MMMCLGVFLLGSNFFGTLWASWTSWNSTIHHIGEVFLHYLFKWVFNLLLFFFSFWNPCDSDVIEFIVVPEVPKPLLNFLNTCFFILVWLDVYFFFLFQIIDLSPSFLPFTVVPCIFCFISVWVAFISSFILRPSSINSVSIPITNVLNSASDRLSIS